MTGKHKRDVKLINDSKIDNIDKVSYNSSGDHMRNNTHAIKMDGSTLHPLMRLVSDQAQKITAEIGKNSLSLDGKKEHQDWDKWKRDTFDPYAKQAEMLQQIYKKFETWRENPHTVESRERFNRMAKLFNEKFPPVKLRDSPEFA